MLVVMRVPQIVLVFSVGLVSACVDLDEESSSGHTVQTNNRLGGNRLGGNRLGGNRLAAGHLASARLSNDTLVLDTDAAGLLLDTEEGREVLAYIISCAAPEGTILTVENPAPGAPSEYFGSLGLAKKWLDRPLDRAGAGWVSACLFARVNANQESVPISLRGSHAQLYTTEDEAAEYTLQEGAFWGNYFTPLHKPIEWYACRGRGQAAGETGGLVDRDCTEPDPANPGKTLCGFTYAGDCFGHRGACDKEKNGNYSECEADDDDDRKGHGHGKHGKHHGYGKHGKHGKHHKHRHHKHGHGWGHGWGNDESREVITTYVQP